MKIMISGGRGFIGSKLIPELTAAGHEVGVWGRGSRDASDPTAAAVTWDPLSGPPPEESLESVDVVVYLSGESVAHKWSDEVKKKIRESRIVGTRNLVDGMASQQTRPKAFICSSATGYYGDRADEELTEASDPGKGFLAEVCEAWEREADTAAGFGIRVVKMRTGMVLGTDGGALPRLISAFETKMGGKLGSGKQWMPWIHLADIAGLYRFAIEKDVSGPMNGSAPNPVRNDAFSEALGEALGQPSKVAVPEFALKMMFGEMSEVILASQRVLPQAALAAGYSFRFPQIREALADVVMSRKK